MEAVLIRSQYVVFENNIFYLGIKFLKFISWVQTTVRYNR
jgi:hypothetical protein